ncbi:MAG: hypothetical protein ACTHM1_08130 [Solirubrobacteraceae bacterium]
MKLSDPKTKRILTLMMAVGALALAGRGTFASFSAETSNGGTSLASGTLTLSNQVESGEACLSTAAKSSNNFNERCQAAMALKNVAPGVFGGVAKITVKNTGSIDASKLYLWAPLANAVLKGALTEGVAVTKLTVAPIEGSVRSKDEIVLRYGTHEEKFEASAAAEGGTESISVTSKSANFSYPEGATATDESSDKTVENAEKKLEPLNTDCYDSKTTEPGTAGATDGAELGFNSPSGSPLCRTALLFIQETTGGKNYCWWGHGEKSESGMCLAPISVKPSSGLSTEKAIESLPVSSLNGNVASGDKIRIAYENHEQEFKASAEAFISSSSTSISIESATPNFAYPTGATITDTKTLETLNSDTIDTISNFDTAHNGNSGKIPLPPVTSNGKLETSPPVELGHYGGSKYERTFYVGLYVPAPAGSNQNNLQGLASTFGISWHLEQ